MVTPHQQVFTDLANGLGGSPRTQVAAVSLDSPYGFQENADELTERIRAYFDESVGREVGPIRFRSSTEAEADPARHATEMAKLRAARWVFAGPGSPSYALRTWVDSGVGPALHDRLSPAGGGGAVVFASAAALTLGAVTVPVYEVYKVGEDPRWLTGLDVLSRATGLTAAVVPHFDNAEGGTHDTRFCYLGERRLQMLERDLPDGTFVLGVDEHTGLIMDLDSRTARVVGRGGVSVRVRDRTTVTPTGSTVTFDQIADWGASTPRAVAPVAASDDGIDGTGAPDAAAVDALLAAGDVVGGVRALLTLESRPDSDRATVSALIARVGTLAATPQVDVRSVIAPYVELLLDLRRGARNDKRYADADTIRDRLNALGVEVRDTADGATWHLDDEGDA